MKDLERIRLCCCVRSGSGSGSGLGVSGQEPRRSEEDSLAPVKDTLLQDMRYSSSGSSGPHMEAIETR